MSSVKLSPVYLRGESAPDTQGDRRFFMTLKELSIGRSGTITRIGGEGALRQHFLDMGLIPGAEVTVIKYAPMGDPVEIRVHGYELTLRLDDAAKIDITPKEASPGAAEKPLRASNFGLYPNTRWALSMEACEWGMSPARLALKVGSILAISGSNFDKFSRRQSNRSSKVVLPPYATLNTISIGALAGKVILYSDALSRKVSDGVVAASSLAWITLSI